MIVNLIFGAKNPNHISLTSKHSIGGLLSYKLIFHNMRQNYDYRVNNLFYCNLIIFDKETHEDVYIISKTYINVSYLAITECVKYFENLNCEIKCIYLFVDDIHICPGQIKIKHKIDRSGHNMLKKYILQIDERIKHMIFKIPVGPFNDNISLNSFVLSELNNREIEFLNIIFSNISSKSMLNINVSQLIKNIKDEFDYSPSSRG